MIETTFPKYRRIHFLIKKKFQVKFIMSFLFVILMAAFMYGAALYAIIYKKFEAYSFSPHLRLKSTGEILGPSLLFVNLSIILLIAFISAMMILFISKKVLEPFLRLKLDALRVEEGTLWIEESPKSGHLSVVAGENFITAVKGIREKIIRMKDAVNTLEITTEKLKLLSEMNNPSIEKVREIISDIELYNNKFKDALSQFKTQ
jgi:hypothetical protein